MDHTPHLGYHAGVIATSTTGVGGAFCWAWSQLVAHGPSWPVVPPLMFGAASLAGAYWSSKKMAQDLAIAQAKADQDRRHDEEIHRIRLDRIRLAGVGAAPALGPPDGTQ